jgi:hypothetical protein
MATTATKRFSGSLSATATKRVSAVASSTITRRVPVVSAAPASPSSYGNNCWVGWGNAWGKAWFGFNAGSGAVEERPAVRATARILEYPTGTNLTNRIHHLLQLEGDESGYLLLEGDAAELESDALRLEGDVVVIGGTVTKRVLELVA